MVKGFFGSSCVSHGHSLVVDRSPVARRDRARRSPAACRPASILRGSPADCRATCGIRPADRPASPPPAPTGRAEARCAALAVWTLCGPGATWRDVGLGARLVSSVRPQCTVWACSLFLLLSFVTVTFPDWLRCSVTSWPEGPVSLFDRSTVSPFRPEIAEGAARRRGQDWPGRSAGRRRRRARSGLEGGGARRQTPPGWGKGSMPPAVCHGASLCHTTLQNHAASPYIRSERVGSGTQMPRSRGRSSPGMGAI